jgi:hypothetical protein
VTAANLTGPLTVTMESVSGPGVSWSPTTVEPAPGELVKLSMATWAAAGTAQVRGTAPGGIVSNTLSVTVSAAPAPGPTPPPSPPPAPEGQATGTSVVDVVSVQPVGSWAGSKPWTCGLLFRRGAAPAGRPVGAHDGSVQVDWLTTWDDGSLRFARASGITTSAEVPILTRGVVATGSNVAEPSVAATVSFANVVDHLGASVAGGSFTADIATARTAGAGTWGSTQARLVRSLLGPVCSEFHYFVPTADVHTSVWFYVRAYSSGDTEVETVVENGWLLVAAPGQRTYDVTLSVGGSTRYAGAGIVHRHHTRWSRVDWAGTDPSSAMVQAPASLRAGGLIPAMGVESLAATAYTDFPQTGTKHAAWTRDLADRATPFAIANIDPALGSGGDTDMYGLIPEWGATWLIEGHTGAYWSIVGNARAMGRFALHYRDEDDGRPPRGSARLTVGYGDSANLGISSNTGNSAVLTPAPTGSTPPSWTFSHGPAGSFMAALLTARWSMLEGLQFQVASGELMDTAERVGFRLPGWYGQNRALGWRYRDRAHAEAITPSILNGSLLTAGAEHAQRVEAVGRIEALAEEWMDMYVSGSGTGTRYSARGNALGAPYQNADFDHYGSNLDGLHGYGGLQNGIYITGALYVFNARPTVSAGAQSKLDAVAGHLAKYPRGLLGAEPGATRDWRVFVHVTIPVGTPGTTGSGLEATTYYASWDFQYAQQQSALSWTSGTWPLAAGTDTFLRRIAADPTTGNTTMRLTIRDTFLGDTDMIALCWAAQQMHEAAGRVSVPGADLAIQRLLTSGTWVDGVANLFRERPLLSAKTPRALPSWVPSAVGTAALVPMTNTLQSIWAAGTFDRDKGTSPLSEYSGGVYNPNIGAYGIFAVHGGGHAANNDNGVYSANINTLAWQADFPATDLADSGKWVNYVGGAEETGSLRDSYDYFTIYGSGSTDWAAPSNTSGRQFPAGATVTSAGACETLPGVPGSAHTYQTMISLPPPFGGGARGSLVRLTSAAVASRASRDNSWVHRYDFAAGTWERYGTNAAAWAAPGATAVLDTTRGVAHLLNPPQRTVTAAPTFNFATATWTNTSASVPSVSGYVDNSLGAYHAERDIIVQATCANPATDITPALFYWHAGNSNISTRAAVTWTGDAPRHFNFGQGSLVYLPSGQLFYYTQRNAGQYYLIDVPANPANPWTATAYSISGTLPSSFSPVAAGSIYGRMDYCAAAKSILWLTGQGGGQTHFGGRVWALRIIE